MVFVYVSLGIAMFTALGMINETAISIFKQDFRYGKISNEYLLSKYKENDKNFLEILDYVNSSWGQNVNNLCDNILYEINADTQKSLALKKYKKAIDNNSINSDYSNYSMLSCILKQKKLYCDFEY